MDKNELFSVAGRKSATVKVGDGELEVRALDLDGRFGFNGTDGQSLGERFAFIAIHSCPSLAACTVTEVVTNLDPEVLSEIATMAMSFSGMGADAEAQAEKNSESEQS
jgi:hypothetical protein